MTSATVTTSMNTANLSAASAAFIGSWSLASALSWAAAAYNNAYDYSPVSTTTESPSLVSGRFSNGDNFSATGSNLTSYPNAITQLDYSFLAHDVTVSLYGNVVTSANGSQSGYVSKVVVSSPNYGSITILGYDDVASYSPASISSVTSDFNGMHASGFGSLAASTSVVGGYYQASLSGSYTLYAFSYGGQSMQLGNISIPASLNFSNADSGFAYALSGNDMIVGSTGHEILAGYAGNDTLDGGSGTDTAVFSGNLSAYTLTRNGSTYTLRDNSGSDGTDTLTNIERLQFSDTRIALDIAGNQNACFDTSGLANAGQVYRLYEAMFNRAPDQAGLAYWIGQADVSTPLTTIATTFASGLEYRNKYGNLGDQAFIDQLYLNVLGRAGEAAGAAYWYGQLDTLAMSREQVLVGFSESTENQAAVIGVIQNGIDFTV